MTPRSRTVIEIAACAEISLRLVRVVRAAPELQILDARHAAGRERHHVMKLEEARLSAAAMCADECALPSVAIPDRPPHRGRHMARA